VLAQLRRHATPSEGIRDRQVLVALPDPAPAAALTAPLARLGYTVEDLALPEESGRLLEEGVYEVVVTSRAAVMPGLRETLYQRITRLSPDARRRIFLILVGDEFRTGDGTQAFTALADLVVHPKDAGASESVLLNALVERNRLYRAYLDARQRFEASAG